MTKTITRKASHFELEMAKNNQDVSSFGGIPLLRKALTELGLFKNISGTFYINHSAARDRVVNPTRLVG